MIGYGLAYREHQSLRTEQLELKSEIEVAANMQADIASNDYSTTWMALILVQLVFLQDK